MRLSDRERSDMADVLTEELAVNWSNTHPNKSLGKQRMLAKSLVPLVERWITIGAAAGWEVGYQRGVRDEAANLERADNPYLEGL